MPEPNDPAPPPQPSRPRRTRKFVLPDHHHDERQAERTDERIEAFLTASPAPRRRRKASTRVRRPLELETRPDWMAAVRHETARHERYGRPASILLIGLPQAGLDDGLDRLAHAVGDAIRAEARETDRAVRYDATTFRVLLPETGDRAARAVADRLDRAFQASADAKSLAGDLVIDVVCPTRYGTLEDALADAERRMAARSNGNGAATPPADSAG